MGRSARRGGLALLAALAFTPAPAQEAGEHPGVPPLPPPRLLPAPADLPFQLPPLPPAPAAATDTPTRFVVRRFAFRGNTAIATGELEELAAPYRDRPVGAAELELLRQTLSRHYIDRGYLNSGVVFAQPSFADGTLSFDVIEGRLAQVRVRGAAGLAEAYLGERLARPDDGALNVDTLRERFQLLLDDPLFSRIEARLSPGLRTGEAILDVDVERRRPYQLTAFANNARAPSIGSRVAGLRGWVRNLSGRGDLLEASAQVPLGGDPGNSYSLNWQLPIDFRGTGVELHLDRGDSALVETPISALGIESRLETRQLGVHGLLFERLRHKLRIGLDYVERDNRTTLMGVPFSFVANESSGTVKTQSWRFWQEYSYRTERQVLALRSTFVDAGSNLDAPPATPAGSRYLDPNFRYWLGQGRYLRVIARPDLQLSLRATVQSTADRLPSLEGLAIGGAGSVRGYRENQLIRDRGVIVNAEIEIPVIGGGEHTLTVAPFYDYGRGRNIGEASTSLASAGLALRYRRQGFSLEIAGARRLRRPAEIANQSGDLQDRGVHFQIAYDFFAD